MQTIDTKNHNSFEEKVDLEEKRKLKWQSEKKRSVWSGLGLFGMVGWSVVVPMLLGTALGVWLDKNHPTSFSWTLTLLIAGLILGCGIAWNWVAKENKNTNKNEEDVDE
jgi:ATP synthase protein I